MIYAMVLATTHGEQGRSAALETDVNGQRFIERIRRTAFAAGVERLVVVVGPPDAEAVRKALPPGVAWVANPRPERGVMSSVQVGLTALPSIARGALLWPVDVPFIEEETIRALIAAGAGGAMGRLVIPTYKKKDGFPLRLPRALFGDVGAMSADSTLGALIAGRADAVRVAVDDAGIAGPNAQSDHVADEEPSTQRGVKRSAPVSAASPLSVPPPPKRSPRPRPAKAR